MSEDCPDCLGSGDCQHYLGTCELCVAHDEPECAACGKNMEAAYKVCTDHDCVVSAGKCGSCKGTGEESHA